MKFLHDKGGRGPLWPTLGSASECELGNFESFVFFFNLDKHASEGQVAALFRVKRLQPCGTAECYTLIRQGLAMYCVRM